MRMNRAQRSKRLGCRSAHSTYVYMSFGVVWALGLRMLCPTTASSDRVQGFTFERRDDWGWEVAQEVRLSVFMQIFAWREGQWLHTSLTLLSGHTDVLSADAA